MIYHYQIEMNRTVRYLFLKLSN